MHLIQLTDFIRSKNLSSKKNRIAIIMKIIKSLFLLSTIVLLTSCGNYTEEITINEDGSGTYHLYSDVISGSLNMAVNMSTMFVKEPLTEAQLDSVRSVVENKVWEDFPDEVDSVIDLMKEMPDSLINYGDNKKHLERMVAYMKGSRDKGYINFGMEYSFKNKDEFLEYMEFLQKAKDEDKGDGPTGLLNSLSTTDSKTKYVLNDKKFSRSVRYTKKEGDGTMGKMLDMFGGEGRYTTVIKTKKKIKKVKAKNIKSQSHYEVVLEYNFKNALSGEANTDFEIVFE